MAASRRSRTCAVLSSNGATSASRSPRRSAASSSPASRCNCRAPMLPATPLSVWANRSASAVRPSDNAVRMSVAAPAWFEAKRRSSATYAVRLPSTRRRPSAASRSGIACSQSSPFSAVPTPGSAAPAVGGASAACVAAPRSGNHRRSASNSSSGSIGFVTWSFMPAASERRDRRPSRSPSWRELAARELQAVVQIRESHSSRPSPASVCPSARGRTSLACRRWSPTSPFSATSTWMPHGREQFGGDLLIELVVLDEQHPRTAEALESARRSRIAPPRQSALLGSQRSRRAPSAPRRIAATVLTGLIKTPSMPARSRFAKDLLAAVRRDAGSGGAVRPRASRPYAGQFQCHRASAFASRGTRSRTDRALRSASPTAAIACSPDASHLHAKRHAAEHLRHDPAAPTNCHRRQAHAARAGPAAEDSCRPGVWPRDSRAVKWKMLPRPGVLATPTSPPMSCASRLLMARPETSATVFTRRRRIRLRERLKQPFDLIGSEADTGVLDFETQQHRWFVRFSQSHSDDQRSLIGELDSVRCIVDEDLAQTQRIAAQIVRHVAHRHPTAVPTPSLRLSRR